MFRSSPPQAPMSLMFLGIIPFIASAGAMVVWRDDIALMITAATWLMVYGAVILSFLGGVRWGVEIAKRERPRFAELVPSVLGALAGWTLVLVTVVAMAAALALHYFYDLVSPEVPRWYRQMRVWPTLGAVLSLAVAYFLLSRS
jgi:hypothetical protein